MTRNRLFLVSVSIILCLSLLLSACASPPHQQHFISQPTAVPQANSRSAAYRGGAANDGRADYCANPVAHCCSNCAAPQGGKLVFGLQTEPVSLDPAAVITSPSKWSICMCYDPLIWTDPQLKLEPGLATSWEMSPDGKEFTLKLRQDVKFQDGTPFMHRQVKTALTRAATGVGQAAAVAITIMTDYITTT